MPIAESKTRTIITIDKNDKKILEQIAKKQDRSFNYIANQAIKDYIKRNAPDKEDKP